MSGIASPKQENEPGAISARMQQAIEEQIAALTEDLVASLATARATDPKEPARLNERANAVGIAGATASLLQALSRAKNGIRLEHRVVREQRGAPRVRVGWNGDPTELLADAEYEALDDYEKVDYCNWTYGLPPTYNLWRRDSYKKPATVDQLEELRKDLREVARRTPYPPEKYGSNKE